MAGYETRKLLELLSSERGEDVRLADVELRAQ